MWFVINIKPGHEEQAVELLRAAPATDGVQEVFCPMAVAANREGGMFVEKRLPMFDGCVFAIAPSKWELRKAIRHADGIGHLLDDDRSFEPVDEAEADFINALAGAEGRAIDMSEAVVLKGGFLNITNGPLLGREQEIRKRSGHARWAYLDSSVAGKPRYARLGLRVTRNDSLHPWER